MSAKINLAVVSTYDELCGIAGYTRCLVPELAKFANVTVMDLDQFLLRSLHKRVQRLGDEHIAEMAEKLKGYDAVNIQLEHGTLARDPVRILRRFNQLAEASRNLTVTFHTILGSQPLPWGAMGSKLAKGRVITAGEMLGDGIRGSILAHGVYRTMRRLQNNRRVSAIVHTRRDGRLMQSLHGIKNVEVHPLSFVPPAQAQTIRANTKRADFPLLHGVPDNAKLIGTFGFLSPYKGFETAIRAIRMLPEDHHLLVFGGVHPQTIKRHAEIDPYVQTLLDTSRVDTTVLEGLAGMGGGKVQVATGEGARELFEQLPGSLRGRVHFMGVLPDSGFQSAMALCDAVVLPYLEVGQTSSGPISVAVDMGCRVIASRTHAFQQFDRFHPGAIEFFDIGNHVELASHIQAPRASGERVVTHNTDTNLQAYARALGVTIPEGVLEQVA